LTGGVFEESYNVKSRKKGRIKQQKSEGIARKKITWPNQGEGAGKKPIRELLGVALKREL